MSLFNFQRFVKPKVETVSKASYAENIHNSYDDNFKIANNVDSLARAELSSLFIKMMTDCLSRVTGLPDELKNLLYEDNTFYDGEDSTTVYKGLLAIMLDAYLQKSPFVFSLDYLQNDWILYPADHKNFNNELAFKIHFYGHSSVTNPYPVDLLLPLFENIIITEQRIMNCVTTKGAFVVQYDNFRKGNATDAQQQTAGIRRHLRGEDAIAILDKNDLLTLLDINFADLLQAKADWFNQICHKTRLPLSYVSGTTTGALNTTGDGDVKQLENALQIFFNCYLKPVFKRILKIAGYKDVELGFKTGSVDNVVSFVQALDPIESSGLLTEKTKLNLLISLAENALDNNIYNILKQNTASKSLANEKQNNTL